MKRRMGLVVLALALSTLTASAQLMDDQRSALEGYCGEAIQTYCPKVDADDLDSLWDCLSPHFDQIDPMCKVTIQEIQQN